MRIREYIKISFSWKKYLLLTSKYPSLAVEARDGNSPVDRVVFSGNSGNGATQHLQIDLVRRHAAVLEPTLALNLTLTLTLTLTLAPPVVTSEADLVVVVPPPV